MRLLLWCRSGRDRNVVRLFPGDVCRTCMIGACTHRDRALARERLRDGSLLTFGWARPPIFPVRGGRTALVAIRPCRPVTCRDAAAPDSDAQGSDGQGRNGKANQSRSREDRDARKRARELDVAADELAPGGQWRTKLAPIATIATATRTQSCARMLKV
jgi:hypothetical protein